jgi:hypothetical protein
VVPAWQGDATAAAALQAEARSRPLESTPPYWNRVVAIYRGDQEASRRYGIWLAIMNSPDNALPPVGRLTFGPAKPSANYILDGYGSLYRRQILRAQVVDLLPQLVLQATP